MFCNFSLDRPNIYIKKYIRITFCLDGQDEKFEKTIFILNRPKLLHNTVVISQSIIDNSLFTKLSACSHHQRFQFKTYSTPRLQPPYYDPNGKLSLKRVGRNPKLIYNKAPDPTMKVAKMIHIMAQDPSTRATKKQTTEHKKPQHNNNRNHKT